MQTLINLNTIARTDSTGLPILSDRAFYIFHWARLALGASVCLWSLAAGFLLWRSAIGALSIALPSEKWILLGLLLGGFTLLIKAIATVVGTSRLAIQLIRGLLLAANLTIGFALIAPASSPWSVGLFGLIVVGAALSPTHRERYFRPKKAKPLPCPEITIDQPHSAIETTIEPPEKLSPLPIENDPELTHQSIRRQDSSGRDIITGSLRTEIAPNGRLAHIHLAFCPAFPHHPTLEVRQSFGPPARIKTVQVLAYGARIDVRLSRAATETTPIGLEYTATVSTD
jgi:hypothetical protein